MLFYFVNNPESAFSKFIRIREVICSATYGVEVELQGFGNFNFVFFVFFFLNFYNDEPVKKFVITYTIFISKILLHRA